MMAVDIVMERAAFAQGNADQIAFRRICSFLDRIRHFARLTMAKADPALLIADNDKRRKPEAAAALHHFGDAVDVNEFVDELAVAIVAVPFPASAMWFSSHEPTLSFFSSPSLSRPLKI